MSSWYRNEYFLKGLFLGLWAFFAFQVPDDSSAAWRDIAWVVGWTAAGLFIGLGVGVWKLMKRGLKPWNNWRAFPILVLLESAMPVYAGILFGLGFGVLSGNAEARPWAEPLAHQFGLTWHDIAHQKPVGDWLTYFAIGGLVLGFGLYRMRQIEDERLRFYLGLFISILAVYLVQEYITRITVEVTRPDPDNPEQSLTSAVVYFERDEARYNFGLYLLLGLPFFYLLMFCGETEETEVDLMAFCGMLGVALYLIGIAKVFPGISLIAPFIVPVTLYWVYGVRFQPGLRVFKHILRGYGYVSAMMLAEAIQSFNRALALDPGNPMATQGIVTLHNNLTLDQVEADPRLQELLDFNLCLDRAQALMMQPPTAKQLDDATRFLNLVTAKAPRLQARVDYLRAVAQLHARQPEAAVETLSRLLDPETPGYDPTVRQRVLFDAWFLALDGPKSLTERLGWSELNKPGRRIEAIGAVERRLATEPTHDKAREYRTALYSQLTEREFVAAAANGIPTDFNYEYVEQLGYQLVDHADPDRRERGMGYLRIAAKGREDRAPGIFQKLAQVSEKLGDPQAARTYTESIKAVGLRVTPRQLSREQREIYQRALMKLAALAEADGDVFKAQADEAQHTGDLAARDALDAKARPHYELAIENLHLYREAWGNALLTMYRKVAEIYAKMRDPLNACINVAAALEYDRTDPDLLTKRDSYYYSVPVERLQQVKENVGRWFDVGYCVSRAISILNAKDLDADLLDWATHLIRLAQVMEPDSNRVRFVEARCLLRKGERDAALQILEDTRERPKGSGVEEEAWYNTTKLLGQLYLDDLGRPDLALKAFADYKNYHKSGADTLYQIGRCYEALGDRVQAIKFYDAVTAYEDHPRYWDAKEALKRLKGG